MSEKCHKRYNHVCLEPSYLQIETFPCGNGFVGEELPLIVFSLYKEDQAESDYYIQQLLDRTKYITKGGRVLPKNTVNDRINDWYWLLGIKVGQKVRFLDPRSTWGRIPDDQRKQDGKLFLREKIIEIAQKYFRCVESVTVVLKLSKESNNQEIKVKLKNENIL